MSEQTNEELRAAIDTLTRDAARLTTERAFTDEEWRRDMADLRAQMDRARVEAASDYATLTRERDEARAALRAFAPTCASGAIATWSVRRNEAPTRCDACRRDTSVEHEHAAALRAAEGGR